ncbi:MAG TPA: AAA family ATPase [Gammaproteobacteria bacterium]|nr:AAA family ATPase [Gammaproteobacteria bacterium]
MTETGDWSSLGFLRMPFNQQDCIPKLSYSIPAYSVVLESLQEGVKEPFPKVMVLSGARGVGKSSLIESFISSLSSDMSSRLIQGSRGMGVNNLLKCILDLTGADFSLDSSEAETQLKLFCESLQSANSRFILVVDNAHVLPIQTLAAISEMIKSFSRTISAKIILVGQPVLLDRLSQFDGGEDLGDRFCSLTIKPFSYVELHHYISSRLYESGWKGSPKNLSQKAMERIFHQTHGVARRINHVAEYELQSLISEPRENIISTTISGFTLPNKHMALFFSGVLLAASSLYAASFFHKSKVNSKQVAATIETVVKDPAVKTNKGSVQEVLITWEAPEKRKDAALLAEVNTDEAMQDNKPSPVKGDSSTRDNTPSMRQSLVDENLLEKQQVESDPGLSEVSLQGSEKPSDQVSEVISGKEQLAKVIAEQTNEIASKHSPINQEKSSGITEKEQLTKIISEQAAEIADSRSQMKAVAPLEAEKKTEVADKGAETQYYDLQQKVEKDTQKMKVAKGFSLQLGAVTTIEKLKLLLQQIGVNREANLRVYQGIRGENPVYVVLLAEYPSYSLAKKALGALPEKIQRQNPWVRNAKSISEDIRVFESMLIA